MGYISRRWLNLPKKKRLNSGYRYRVYPDKLSRGQKIFLTLMTISLLVYVALQMVKLYG